jgi:RNA-directed DNA polymerase
MLEEILDRRNIENALKQVTANKGTGGVDGMKHDELRPYINTRWQELCASILEDNYQPSPVRKVEIPKPGGGKRMLGIPTLQDRLIQQSISQWLIPQYEPEFDEWSYGFRPGRSAHHAIKQALEFLKAGYVYVVEIDLAKFFDRVNHDKLIGQLRKKITDRRIIKLIRSYLANGIMEGGVSSPRVEGTPQGSPLSPILSNIVLNELDKELRRRGHKFVRYADDCTIYVKSEKAAQRVCESITGYIEGELKLEVNKTKTRTGRAEDSNLLGYTFGKNKRKGEWEACISNKSLERIKDKCRQAVQRSKGQSEQWQISKLNALITGWVNYFIHATLYIEGIMKQLDKHVRMRLRMCRWKDWKSPKTRAKELIKHGIRRTEAKKWSNTRKG